MYDMSSHGFQWAHDKCTSLLLKRSKISLFIELQTWFCFTRNSRYITPRSLALTYWKQAACKQACLMWICWPWHNRHGWLGVKNHVQISLSLSLLPDIRKTGRVTTGMQARFLYCQTRKRLKRTLFIRTKHDMRIFGVISCFFFQASSFRKLWGAKSQDSVHRHNFWRKKRAEMESNQNPSDFQPKSLPLGQTGWREPRDIKGCLT